MTKQERMKLLRILRGYTQAGLATAAGLNQSAVASYERGTYKIPEMVVTTLAPLLGVDPAYLTFGYPVLSGKVWEPPREGKGLAADLAILMPPFCEENHFLHSDQLRYLDGNVILLTGADRRHCLLFLTTSTITDAVLPVLPNLKIVGSTNTSPPTLLLRQFSIADFGQEKLATNDFQWPENFAEDRWPIEVKRVFAQLIDEALPIVLHTLIGTKLQWSTVSDSLLHHLRVPLIQAVDRILASENDSVTAESLRKELRQAISLVKNDALG